jgi:hypothetical protein
MEEYLNYTKAYIALLQSSLSEEELEKSKKAGEEMFHSIHAIIEKHQLSIREMLNATLAIHQTILEVIHEQLEISQPEEVED